MRIEAVVRLDVPRKICIAGGVTQLEVMMYTRIRKTQNRRTKDNPDNQKEIERPKKQLISHEIPGGQQSHS